MAKADGTAPRAASAVVVAAAAALALALALLVRAPARGLPIEGDAVAHGALARSIARGEGYEVDGAPHARLPPLWPVLVAAPVAGGASVTEAERALAWALGGLGAALAVLLGARWGLSRASLFLLAALAACHPSLVLYAGGLSPGAEALSLCLVLGLALCLSSERRAAGVAAAVLAGLLPLARYDALPFTAAAFALAWARSAASASPGRARLTASLLAFVPCLAWLARTWLVAGRPFEMEDVPALGRLGGNVLVLAGLVLPVAGLGVLWPFLPSGLRRLWSGGDARPAARALLLAAAVHLLLVAFTAGRGGGAEGALSFAAGSLRQALVVVPLLLVAALLGLESAPPAWRRPVACASLAIAVPLGVASCWASLERLLPAGPVEAARLDLLARAYDDAVREAGASGWVALDLLPRAEPGVEVFLGERAPGVKTGVVVAPKVGRPGSFPRPPVLPLVDGLPRDAQAVLLTDRTLEGLIYTGDRPDLRVGGQGIFHRVLLREVRGGRAGAYSLHAVRRPKT